MDTWLQAHFSKHLTSTYDERNRNAAHNCSNEKSSNAPRNGLSENSADDILCSAPKLTDTAPNNKPYQDIHADLESQRKHVPIAVDKDAFLVSATCMLWHLMHVEMQ
ncbi:hypothetical protein GQR58_029540 [Nymphon striatum]|nr:hypothetical protein GQR58_029540 [Nymphon striatum]